MGFSRKEQTDPKSYSNFKLLGSVCSLRLNHFGTTYACEKYFKISEIHFIIIFSSLYICLHGIPFLFILESNTLTLLFLFDFYMVYFSHR